MYRIKDNHLHKIRRTTFESSEMNEKQWLGAGGKSLEQRKVHGVKLLKHLRH